MPELLFTTKVRHGDAGARVECSGELDISTSQLLEDALNEAFVRSPSSLHIDLTNTTFFAGIGGDLLFDLRARCSAASIPLTVTASSHVRRVLDLLGFPTDGGPDHAHHRFRADLHEGTRAH